MYLYISIYMYIYMYIYIYIYLCNYIHIFIYIYIYLLHIYICIFIWSHTFVIYRMSYVSKRVMAQINPASNNNVKKNTYIYTLICIYIRIFNHKYLYIYT
jgi:hypothetical protein